MDEPKDGTADTQDANPGSDRSGNDAKTERAEREERVRRKLQQMFGDDSPQTVLHFLSDLAQDGADEPLATPLLANDLLDSEPN